MTGLIIQPIIGYFFRQDLDKLDEENLTFSRRFLASAALFIMPNSPVLWFAAGMLWIMDASINVSDGTISLLLAIIFRKTTYHGICHAKFFYGIGAYCIKTTVIFTYYGVQNTAPLGIIPDSVKYSFYLGGIVFIVTVLWTVITLKNSRRAGSFENTKNHFIKKTFLLIGI
jgi:maltose/moltooligosaccharide transporter